MDSLIKFLNMDSFPVSLVTALIVLSYASKQLHPLIQMKIKNEKNINLRHALSIADNLASVSIAEAAKLVELSKPERKHEVIRFTTDKLNDRGYRLDADTVSAIVERAYAEYKRTNPHKGAE